MKRGPLCLLTALFLSLFLASQVYALEIKTDKTQFAQGETFFAALSGNILEDIKIENVGFYKGHVQVPFTFDITKFNQTYYIYAILPYTEDNYTLRIKEVYYKESNKVQTATLEKSFQIINSTADFNIRPGFIVTDKNFTFSLYNNLDSDLEVSYIIENKTNYISLPLQETTKLTILIDDISQHGFMFMQVNSPNIKYNIPLYLIKTKTNISEENETDENKTFINKEKLRFSMYEISVTLNKDQSLLYQIYISNFGQLNATDVVLSVSKELKDYITIKPNKFNLIESGDEVEINLTSKFTKIGNYTGYLFANSSNSSAKLGLEFRVGTNVTFNSSIIDEKTCSELGGKKCTICYGSSIVAEDGLCCIGSCESKSSNTTNWTAIYIVAGLLVLILIFVLLKFRKQKKSARDVLDKKSKSFSDRFETRGSLTRE